METSSNEVSDSITDIINAGKDIPTKNITDNLDNLLKSIREEKHESYFKQKLTKAHNKKSNDTAIDETSSNTNVKPTWPAVTCLVVGNSILTVIDVKQLSKPNQFVKVCKFRGANIDDLKRYLVPLLKKEPNNIFLHVGINDAV